MGLFRFFRRKHEPFSFVPDSIIHTSGRDPILDRLDALEKNINQHTTSEISELSVKMGQTFAVELKRITDRLDTMPAETRQNIELTLSQLSRARTPFAVKTLTEEVSRKVTGAISDVIDTALVNLVQEKKKVTSTEMLKLVAERGICSRASFFRHIQQLERRGRVRKLREGKIVYYVMPEPAAQSQESQIKAQPVADTATSAPETPKTS